MRRVVLVAFAGLLFGVALCAGLLGAFLVGVRWGAQHVLVLDRSGGESTQFQAGPVIIEQ